MSGSNTFGGTIKLEGEKAYRQAISGINSDLKVLASEMSKVTAEFGKNNTSTSSLASKSKVLNEQIERQKEKISTLKGALEQSSEKYGENDKRTNNWKTSLNKAETELSKMENSLSEINSEMEKSKTPLDKLNSKLSEQSEKLKSLQTQYKNVVLEQGKNSTEAKSLASQIKSLNSDIKENKNKLNEAENATNKLGGEMEDTGKKASVFGDVLKANLASDAIKAGLNGIVKGVKSLASAITDVILKPGFDRAMNIEGAQFKLKGLGHDAQTVDEIMQNALASVKGTAYGLDDASTVAASAVAAGITPGKDLERTLKLVADASAIAGSDMGEMGAIFNKVASAGKMSAEEINQLNERGIPITQLLAETMNVSTEEIKNLVSAGKIGFPELQNAIEKGMGGAAQTMGQTFEGAVSNVQAAFSRLGAGIMTPFTSALTPALGIATSIIDDIAAGTTENIQVKTNQLGEMLKTACSSLLSGLEPLLNSLLEIVKQLLPELAKILPDLVKMGMEIIKNLVNGIAQALPTLIPVAVEMINTILNGLVGMLPTLVQAAIKIVVALVNGISDSLPTLIPAIVEAVILIAQTLIDNIDILLQAAINLFMALVKAIPEIIKVLVPKIPDIITSIVNALVENIPILLAGAIELFMAMVQAIPEIVVVLVQNLPQIVTAIIEGLSRLPELIWNIMTECISKFFDWGNQSESAGTEGSQSFLDTVINVIKELPQKVWEWLQNTINNVGNFFSNIINIGITKSGEFVNSMVNVIRNLPGQIWTWLLKTIQNVISWGSDMVSRGRQAALDLFNAIVNKVKEIPGQMFSIGSNIVSGIWNGISNSIGWITNKVKEFAGSILNGIKSALGIHSPSKVFEEQVGKNMALGVGEGFKNAMNSVQRQMQNAIPTSFNIEPALAVSYNTDLKTPLERTQNIVQTGITVNIENFVNNRSQDVQAFAQELEFYARRSNFATG